MLRMLKERLSGSEIKILILLFTIIISHNPSSFLMSYLLEHSPHNYSIFMWNNTLINNRK